MDGVTWFDTAALLAGVTLTVVVGMMVWKNVRK